MRIFKKYFQKRKIKDKIYKEYENALENKDYIRTGILSKRFLKIK
jgi:N-glycosylase/DNA lyase